MKAITIDADYAWMIHDQEKTVECRTWKTKYRGEVLICSSKAPIPGYVSGYALCTAKIVDVVPFTEEHLEAAMMEELPDVQCYAWILDDVQFIYPIKVRGMPGLFTVDDALIKYVQDEHTDAMTDEEFDKFYEEFYRTNVLPLIYLPAQL